MITIAFLIEHTVRAFARLLVILAFCIIIPVKGLVWSIDRLIKWKRTA